MLIHQLTPHAPLMCVTDVWTTYLGSETCVASVCGLLLVSSHSHIAVERPSRRGMVTVEGIGISSQQLLIPARKTEWQQRYVWTWLRPDKCSRTKWPEVNVLTKQLAHFNFKPLWHEQMREASFVLCVERSLSQMLLDLIDCNDAIMMPAVAQ